MATTKIASIRATEAKAITYIAKPNKTNKEKLILQMAVGKIHMMQVRILSKYEVLEQVEIKYYEKT